MRNRELEKALSEVNTLKGLLPICVSCKKISDDKGYWKQIEIYFMQRPEIEFSHGICPECAVKFYPGITLHKDGNSKEHSDESPRYVKCFVQ